MNINDLRESLADTIQGLKDKKIDTSTAKAIADLGRVMVEATKTEIMFLKQVGASKSDFLPVVEDSKQLGEGKKSNS